MCDRQKIKKSIMDLLEARRLNATICPSEVARELFNAEDWRSQMPLVRDVAGELASENRIEVCQKGVSVDIKKVTGPIRLRLK